MLLRFLKNTFIIIALVCIGYSPIFYFNICQDPYSIFTSDFSNRSIEPNSRFIKMRFIASGDHDFDSFIFGNSRANNVNPQAFTNGKYFNMYYSLGLPKEHLEDIELLVSNGIKVKNIVIFLDYSSYSTSPDRVNDMLRTPYTGNKIKLLKNYINYCFKIPDEQFKKDYNNSAPSPIYIKMFETGQAENKVVENFIENNKQAHINDPKFNNPLQGYLNRMDETISEITAIKKICDSNKIKLSIVMNPIHKTTYMANDHELYFSFLRKISNISDFYDFSGINKITTNNYFYYETSHYRPLVGDAMISFIQNRKQIDTIPDFGNYISKQNIDSRLSQLKNQL